MLRTIIALSLGCCLLTRLVVAGTSPQGKDLALVPASGPLKGQRIYANSHALLIGINQYPNLPRNRWLEYAVADATALREVLVRHYGFPAANIRMLTDREATKAGIERALAAFADKRKVQADDRLLIFFSGHGQTVKLPSGGDMGFLIPYDAEVDLDDFSNAGPFLQTCIRMDTVWGNLESSPAKHALVLADACYSGLLTRSKSLEPISGPALAALAAKRALQVVTAGRRGEKAFEIAKYGHSAFTHKLIEELRARATMPGQVFTATDLYASLQRSVANLTEGKQSPQLGSYNTEGEFLFISTPTVSSSPLANVLFGRIRSVDRIAKRLTLESGKTTRTVTMAESTVLYQQSPATRMDLRVGQPVGVASILASQAFQVTIFPERVKFLESEEGLMVRGEIAAMDATTISVRTAEGKLARLQVNAQTSVTQLLLISFEGLTPGPLVSVRVRDPDGAVVYAEVVIVMSGVGPASPQDASTIRPGTVRVNPIDGAEMVWIPGGTYQMGSTNGFDDEKPAHTQSVAGFWMYTTEVTNGQFRKFVQANPEWEPGKASANLVSVLYLSHWKNNDRTASSAGNHPVVYVTWHAAKAYAEWAGGRLPTEAEWEYAARGGRQLEYPTSTGQIATDLAHYGSPNGSTKVVGGYPPNPFGLYDMAGNVQEWCNSLYRPYAYSANDGREHPTATGKRVARGSPYYQVASACASSRRDSWTTDFCVHEVGFRVVVPSAAR